MICAEGGECRAGPGEGPALRIRSARHGMRAGQDGNDYQPPPSALRQSASEPQTSFFGTSLEAAAATTFLADAAGFSAAAVFAAVEAFAGAEAFAAAVPFAGAAAFAAAVNLALGTVSAATRAEACVLASACPGAAMVEPNPAVTPAAAAIRVTNRVRGILFIICSASVVSRSRASGDRRQVGGTVRPGEPRSGTGL